MIDLNDPRASCFGTWSSPKVKNLRMWNQLKLWRILAGHRGSHPRVKCVERGWWAFRMACYWNWVYFPLSLSCLIMKWRWSPGARLSRPHFWPCFVFPLNHETQFNWSMRSTPLVPRTFALVAYSAREWLENLGHPLATKSHCVPSQKTIETMRVSEEHSVWVSLDETHPWSPSEMISTPELNHPSIELPKQQRECHHQNLNSRHLEKISKLEQASHHLHVWNLFNCSY